MTDHEISHVGELSAGQSQRLREPLWPLRFTGSIASVTSATGQVDGKRALLTYAVIDPA